MTVVDRGVGDDIVVSCGLFEGWGLAELGIALSVWLSLQSDERTDGARFGNVARAIGWFSV